MKDADCVAFLQWALPQMHLRWSGFRKVRRQVCKRIERRISELRLLNIQAYREYLLVNPREWQLLDGLCRVSVSRFYRDKRVFSLLEHEVLPQLAVQAQGRGEKCLKMWSAGCASGEEPYTLAMAWELKLRRRFPGLTLQILATDVDPHLLRRAREARYRYSSVKNLPQEWLNDAFSETNGCFSLQPRVVEQVDFQLHDVRDDIPGGPFDLVLCRNLVFTYFDIALQRDYLLKLWRAMSPRGVLLRGVHERLPVDAPGFGAYSERWGTYEKLLSL